MKPDPSISGQIARAHEDVSEEIEDTVTPSGSYLVLFIKASSSLPSFALQVTVMFMDIVGFTAMAKEVSPSKVMDFLNE